MERIKLVLMEHLDLNNVDPRRKVELEDSRMVPPVGDAMANMPRQAAHYEWPKPRLHKGDIIGEGQRY